MRICVTKWLNRRTILAVTLGFIATVRLQAQHQERTANDYMHESSVDHLINRFESNDRDAYQQPEKVMDFLGDLNGKKVMDLGSGSGYFSVKLAARGARVIAADVNEEFQAFIKKRIENDKLHNIEPRLIPYDHPSLKESEVDMVLVVNTYHHIEHRSDYFAHVKRGLTSDGELVIVDFFKVDTPVGPPAAHKVSMDQVVAELKAAGYTSFNIEVNLLPYQFILVAK